MSPAHFIQNTDKTYLCTNCGVPSSIIIREDPSGGNPRVKCSSCNFTFDALDSKAAEAAGAIKASSAEALAAADEPESETIQPREHQSVPKARLEYAGGTGFAERLVSVPARPAYLFVSKDRKVSQVVSKVDFKKMAIKWSERPHDCYELSKLNLNVKVEVATVK